ncbi:glycoside hydrolase family 5 protein [Xylaria intraflava]|nr:glycoside hydrolase family 5 protein [Xylaria intraflava]
MLNTLYQTLAPLALLLPLVLANVQFLGSTIAGGAFGCQIDGTCDPASALLPPSDGLAQISEIIKADGINLFRIPISWQFLVDSRLGGNLDPSNFSLYDKLIQSCLDAGAYCMIDIHNFARWNGNVIGQGGPTDEQFADFWGQLARRYAAHDRIIFELMNDPHDLNVSVWAQTCQSAVTAIRGAGATSQVILLPGTNYDNAATLISSGSADALLAITNPDGTADNLLLDIHNVFSQPNSSIHAVCAPENIGSLGLIAKYLRNKGRKGLISETWASDDVSCMRAFCAQNVFIGANSDVLTGLVTRGTGSQNASHTGESAGQIQNGLLVQKAFLNRCPPTPQNKSTETSSTTYMPKPTVTTPPVLGGTMRLEPVIVAPTSLVLTNVALESLDSTLDIATGTPPPVNVVPTTTPTQPSAALVPEASESSLNGVGSVAVGTSTLWICAVMAAVSLVQL